jgi:hypothetical protein
MRVSLGEQSVTVARGAFPTFADFRTWSLDAFHLPGAAVEYTISTKYTIKRTRFKMSLNAEDAFVAHSAIELRREPHGLTFALRIDDDAAACCCVS